MRGCSSESHTEIGEVRDPEDQSNDDGGDEFHETRHIEGDHEQEQNESGRSQPAIGESQNRGECRSLYA